MTIRFKCPHCQKPLSVKDHLAGKKAACPVCKKAIAIPAPVSAPVDVESFAAEALADQPVEKPPEPASNKTIDFTCPFCDEELKLPADLGGKKTPCPKCTKVIKIPLLQEEKPKDWRSTQRAGPSAAKGNQPEQPTDAWSTAQKSRVSQQAMEEAGAVREPEAKPVGVGGWLRRGFWSCLAVGGALLVFTLFKGARDDSREKNSLKEAKEYLQKLEPLHQAEIHRAAGEIDVRNLRADEALNNFTLARSTLSAMPDEPGTQLERDILLIHLVLSQVEMGGSGDETLKRGLITQRYDWKAGVVQKEILRTLAVIRAPEAKASALRALACKLRDKDKIEEAIGLAANLANENPRFEAQQVGLLVARKVDGGTSANAAVGEKYSVPEAGKPIVDSLARLAYTEGNAFKRDYSEALKFAGAKGPAAGRLESCLAAAAIVLADAKNKDAPKEALPFITEGTAAYEESVKETNGKPPVWLGVELIRLGSRTDAMEKVKGLVDTLPAAVQPRAQLDLFQAHLDKNPAKVGDARIADIGGAPHPARAFAWEALVRHNSRLGASDKVRVEDVDELFRPFIHLGIALGEQDRKQNN